MTRYVCLDYPWETIEHELNSILFKVKTKNLNYAVLKTVTPAVIWYTNNFYDLKFHVFQKDNEEGIHCLYANCPPELIDNIRRVNDFYLKHLSEAGKCVVYHGVHSFNQKYGDSLKFFLERTFDDYVIGFEYYDQGKEDLSPKKTGAALKEMLHTKTIRCQFAFRMSVGIVKGNIVQVKAYLMGLRVAETSDEPLARLECPDSDPLHTANYWKEVSEPRSEMSPLANIPLSPRLPV